MRCRRGFTLLEVLVALAVMATAITVVLQLLSADLRAIAASEDYVAATLKAEAKMREVLDDEELSERSSSEVTPDGYRVDVTVTETLTERTENLPVSLLEVDVTLRWAKGIRDRSMTLKTAKMVPKEI